MSESVTYQATCPGCGQIVTWTQTQDDPPTTVGHNHGEGKPK